MDNTGTIVSDEEQELHDSHWWGERTFRDADGPRIIPFCRDCRVDGFADQPRAFIRCPGPKKPRERCPATMWSLDDLGHQHVCIGGPPHRDHYCLDCQRWFFKAGE